VTRVGGLPQIDRTADVEQQNVLDVDEARKLLAAAAAADPRRAAFYALALDSGARLAELCGLQWSDLDLTARRMTIRRQLLSSILVDGKLDTGPTKTGRPRTVDLSAETVRLLTALKRHQAETLLKNRDTAHRFDLVFSQEPVDLFGPKARVGAPLTIKTLGHDLARLLKAAGVTKRITFHGLRHTSATLLLVAGENPKVVSERLGHKGVEITLNRYSHLLPSMGRGAADRLGALLHG
jgi:integrase